MKILSKRKSIRLKNYDYSSLGYYYVTICTQNRKCILGDIENVEMVLNEFGQIVENVWRTLPNHHPVELDEFQIMPNHVHFVIQITWESIMGRSRPTPTKLGTIVGLFKSECTKQIRLLSKNANIKIWQRNYYEHVVRNEKSLNKIRDYIKMNPKIWERDRNNPDNYKKIYS